MLYNCCLSSDNVYTPSVYIKVHIAERKKWFKTSVYGCNIFTIFSVFAKKATMKWSYFEIQHL